MVRLCGVLRSLRTVKAMSKRIRKKKIRMQLIKALEKMNDGDGIVLVDGQLIKLSHCIVGIHLSDGACVYTGVNACLESVVKVRNQSEVWSR